MASTAAMLELIDDLGTYLLSVSDRDALSAGRGLLVLAAEVEDNGVPRIGYSFSSELHVADMAALFAPTPPDASA
jgi:hypothetical protein